MTIEEALDRSLEEIRYRNASIEDCLNEYPQFANHLRPLLNTALRLEKAHQVRPRREFKNQLRKHLSAPPKWRRFVSVLSITLAIVLALLFLVLAGTNLIAANFMLNQLLPKLPLLLPVSDSHARICSAVAPLIIHAIEGCAPMG